MVPDQQTKFVSILLADGELPSDQNVKMIVLACNTATAVVWEEVRRTLISLF